jgi:hypothetical protein
VDGVKLSHIDKSHLYQELFGPRTIKYWNNHHDIPIPTNCDIDWKASQTAAKKLPQGLRRWKAKFASGWIGVGTKLKQYKWQDHSTCPLCKAPSETVSHVLHCKDPEAVRFAKTRIQETLKPKLTELETDEPLAESILDIATKHRSNIPIRPSSYPYYLQKAIRAQQKIGWDNWFLGRWSPRWQIIQSNYLLSIGSKKSPRRWTAAIIHQFFLLSWDMWSYRNHRLHGNAGILALAKHAELDASIAASLALGRTGMTPQTRHFLYIPLNVLSGYSIALKEQWLSSVRIGRKTFTLDLQQAAPFFQEAAFMRNWQETLQQNP